jgi:hypothetical protein
MLVQKADEFPVVVGNNRRDLDIRVGNRLRNELLEFIDTFASER